MTQDARWVYSYDSENRLISMETHAIARASGIPHEKLEFKYDYLSRRIEKKYTNYTTAGQNYTRTFVWQGWTLLAELDGSTGLVRSYSWNGQQLLGLTDAGTSTTYLAVYDSKSVTGLVNATTGELDAAYEYTAYGETLRASGQAIALDNPIRYSNYYTDVETGLVYYGHRYYNPANGRFLNRDPIAEAGGNNLYGFVGNDPVNRVDVLGLSGECNQRYAESFGADGCGDVPTHAMIYRDADTNEIVAILPLIFNPDDNQAVAAIDGLFQDHGLDPLYGDQFWIMDDFVVNGDEQVERSDNAIDEYQNQGIYAGSSQQAPGGEGVYIDIAYTEAAGHDYHGQYHTLAIVTNPVTGEQFYTRAGPSANTSGLASSATGQSALGGSFSASEGQGSSGGIGFGTLQAIAEPYNENVRVDNPADLIAVQPLGRLNISYGEAVVRANDFANVTNQNQITYTPTGGGILGYNSNSYSFTFVESLGVPRPTPILPAPGWSNGSASPKLQYSQIRN